MKSPWLPGRWVVLFLFAGTALGLDSTPVPALSPAPPPGHEAEAQAPGKSKRPPTYLRDVLPVFMGKCARCHNDQAAGLRNVMDYKTAVRDRWAIKRRVWDSWQGTYYKQPMPAAYGPESALMTEAERRTIRDWVEAGAPRGASPAAPSTLSQADRLEAGQRLFSTICAACHQPAGQGIADRFPPLARSDFLNADKSRAIRIVLNGLQGEIVVNGTRFNNSMPKLPLSDQDIASALTYVYSSFGNSGQQVDPAEVAAARAETPALPEPAPQKAGAKPPGQPSPFE